MDWEDDIDPDTDPAEDLDPEADEGVGASDGSDPAAEPAPATGPDLTRLYDLLGEDEDADTTMLDQVDEGTIRSWPAPARAAFRQLRAAQAATKGELQKEVEAERARLKAETAELEKNRRALTDAQANFAAMFGGKDMREQLRQAAQIDEKTLDLTSPEGMKQLILKQVADQFQGFAKPAIEAAEVAERRQRAVAITDKYPEWQDASFQDAVRAHLKGRKDAGETIAGQLEDAILKVSRERRLATEEASRQKRREAAKRSAAQVSRSASSAGPATSGEVPSEVVRKGGAAIAQWMRDNPKAAAAARAAARRR